MMWTKSPVPDSKVTDIKCKDVLHHPTDHLSGFQRFTVCSSLPAWKSLTTVAKRGLQWTIFLLEAVGC